MSEQHDWRVAVSLAHYLVLTVAGLFLVALAFIFDSVAAAGIGALLTVASPFAAVRSRRHPRWHYMG